MQIVPLTPADKKRFQKVNRLLKKLSHKIYRQNLNLLKRGLISQSLFEKLHPKKVSASVCPKCNFEPMIKVNGKYNCEMCGYIDG